MQCTLLTRKNRKLILGRDNNRYSNLIDDCELLTYASFPAPIQRELAYRIVIPGKLDKTRIETVAITSTLTPFKTPARPGIPK